MFVRLFCCLALICTTGAACAASRSSKHDDTVESGTINRWAMTDRADLPAAKEDPFTLPELASLKDWRSYPLADIMGDTRVDIAADSVQTGKDGIIRYAIAITPHSGVRNVLFEGLDCNTMRYRSYAYGQPDNTWKNLETVKWRVGLQKTVNHWQGPLLKEFCDFTGPSSNETIVKSLRNEPVAKPRDESRGRAFK